MIKKLFSMFIISTFLSPSWAELTCPQLEGKLVEAQTKINTVKVDSSSTIGDYIDTLKRLYDMVVLMSKIVDAKATYQGKPESFVDAVYNLPNSLKDTSIRQNFSTVSHECDTEDSAVCSKALMEITKKDISRIKNQADTMKQSLAVINETPSVVALVKLSQSYANEYRTRKCSEQGDQEDNMGTPSIDCPQNQVGKIDRFGSDVMDVVINSSTSTSSTDRKQLCKDLSGTEHNLAGCVPENKQCAELGKNYALKDNVCVPCTGSNQQIYQSTCYACPKHHEVIHGVCKKTCTGVEIRQNVAPYECLADEASQRAQNLRKQESKQKWGKVLRTSAIIAVAGGAAVGLAFAFKAIFKNYFNSTHTINYNTYTGDYNKYKNGAITNNYDTSTNTYDNSSSNTSNWYNYNSMLGYGSGAGYNPYFQNYGYYNPYGGNPYGWY